MFYHITTYAPHLRRWFSICSENGLQPLNADVSSGAEFLTQYFRKSSCEYSSVNTARSALSSILSAVNRFTSGLLHIKLLKTSRQKSHQQPIQFKAFPHDVSFCVVALIKLYLDKTAALNRDVNSTFFISYASSHKPVSSRTLARWVSAILQKAGIHTKTFKTHSLRSASTSNAFSGGLSLKKNCEGSWMDKYKDVWQIL